MGPALTAFQHELRKDVPIGPAWVTREQYTKHIEVLGGSGRGKTTLTEQLFLGILQREKAGVLHIDPKGTSVERFLGWAEEGRFANEVWYVNQHEKPLRYNPLTIEKNPIRIPAYVDELIEALQLTQADASMPSQHRQMRRYVKATLQALIDLGRTLPDSQDWLFDEARRHRDIAKIRDPAVRAEWQRGVSQAKLESTENWFAAFWDESLRSMFSGDGFDWAEVYDRQAAVLVDLSPFILSQHLARAVGAMFITGLIHHAFHAERKKLWFVVVEDATDYLPDHVGPILTLGREFGLYLYIVHHIDFPSRLQERVSRGCLTKFHFSELDKLLPLQPFECMQTYDDKIVQRIRLKSSQDPRSTGERLKQEVFARPWYGEMPRAEPVRAAGAPGKSAPPPGLTVEVNPQSSRPRTHPGRRGK